MTDPILDSAIWRSRQHLFRSRLGTDFSRQRCTQAVSEDIGALATRFDRISFTPVILRLPNEVLDHIASFLVPTTTVHIMEGTGVCYGPIQTHNKDHYVSARSLASIEFTSQLRNLRYLALVCRRFRPVVERILYQSISLPQPPSISTIGLFQYPDSSLPYLVRTMFSRPDLANRVTSLRIWLRDRRLVKNAAEPGLHAANPYYDVFKAACAQLSEIQMSFDQLLNWSLELHEYQELALHAILISLLPNLKDLELYSPFSHRKVWSWKDPVGRERAASATPNHSYLDVALRNSSISSIHVGSHLPVRGFPTTCLTKLTLDIFFFGDRLDWLHPLVVLSSVETLIVTFGWKVLKHINLLNTIFTKLHPRHGLQIFLRDVVPNTRRFAIESPQGTMPYLGTQLDKRGTELPTLRLDKDPLDIELNSLFLRDYDSHAWLWLISILRPVQGRLYHLKLPDNWYSSLGRNVQSIPSLKQLSNLKNLEVPDVALIANPHGRGYDPEYHDRLAVDFFPTSLEVLRVTQADTETCKWLQEALLVNHLLPELKEVILVFREDYWAILSDGFGDEVHRAGVRVIVHWRGQTKVL